MDRRRTFRRRRRSRKRAATLRRDLDRPPPLLQHLRSPPTSGARAVMPAVQQVAAMQSREPRGHFTLEPIAKARRSLRKAAPKQRSPTVINSFPSSHPNSMAQKGVPSNRGACETCGAELPSSMSQCPRCWFEKWEATVQLSRFCRKQRKDSEGSEELVNVFPLSKE